jgi:hypothetical protein
MSLRINFSCLAELLTCSFERGLVDLAVIFDDGNGFSITISEGCDLFGSLGLAHHIGVALEGLNKDDSLVGNHVKPIGKCFVVKCFASLIVDQLTSFCQEIN